MYNRTCHRGRRAFRALRADGQPGHRTASHVINKINIDHRQAHSKRYTYITTYLRRASCAACTITYWSTPAGAHSGKLDACHVQCNLRHAMPAYDEAFNQSRHRAIYFEGRSSHIWYTSLPRHYYAPIRPRMQLFNSKRIDSIRY